MPPKGHCISKSVLLPLVLSLETAVLGQLVDFVEIVKIVEIQGDFFNLPPLNLAKSQD